MIDTATYPSTTWRVIGVYTQTHEGELLKTTSAFEQDGDKPDSNESWDALVSREGWLPWPSDYPNPDKWEAAYGRPRRGGWTLQHIVCSKVRVERCVRCHQRGCTGGHRDAHD